MCGLVGFITPSGFNFEKASLIISDAADVIKHRGPDSFGHWIDSENGVAIGHRRLSIIDLTNAGNQPILTDRYVLAFNGEIYNHYELRLKLKNNIWKGHSDTETILWCIEEWGLKETLQRCVGMFALSLWDKNKKKLFLTRDRVGEKPLYYGWQGNTFFFSSELKALKKHPDFLGEIDREALKLYTRNGYVPNQYSIFSGIKKLTPGVILEFDPHSSRQDSIKIESYWSLNDIIIKKAEKRIDTASSNVVKDLELLLSQSIKGQMTADVPVGAFLSGGIDSSLVAALMQNVSDRQIKTFSIGFDEQGYNEAPHAAKVAKYLNTDHTELYFKAKDAFELIPLLPTIYDEPFADPSQMPTIIVSRLARKNVKVVLSGDGGDELFCGYGRYSQIFESWKRLSKVPRPLRVASKFILPRKISEGVDSQSIDQFYQFINSQWKGYPNLVLGIHENTFQNSLNGILSDAKERMMYYDTLTYLPDDILVKVDRASMSVGLETRVPMLDHRVIEFAWNLMIDIKAKDGIGKWPLKQILHKYVPVQLVDRPKMGFGVPLDKWLRGPLREWAENLLSLDRLNSDGFFDAKIIRRTWVDHLSGKNRQYGLWTILMFQEWFNENKFNSYG